MPSVSQIQSTMLQGEREATDGGEMRLLFTSTLFTCCVSPQQSVMLKGKGEATERCEMRWCCTAHALCSNATCFLASVCLAERDGGSNRRRWNKMMLHCTCPLFKCHLFFAFSLSCWKRRRKPQEKVKWDDVALRIPLVSLLQSTVLKWEGEANEGGEMRCAAPPFSSCMPPESQLQSAMLE